MKSIIPWKQKEHHAGSAGMEKDWFDQAWRNPFSGLLPFSSIDGWLQPPRVDVTEDDRSFTVRAELPGLSEKDIELSWRDGVLHLQGEKRGEKEERGKNRYYRECSYGSFSRDIPIGKAVDWKGAKAAYKNGVLTVTMPKTGESRKRIEIKVQ